MELEPHSRRNVATRSSVVSEKGGQKGYIVYGDRWLILSSCCFLALSNAMQWFSYVTLTDQMDAFYCGKTECRAAFMTNQIFQAVAVITGLGGMYITDYFGIWISVILGTSLNFFGSLIRLASSLPQMEESSRQYVLHSGSVMVACAQAFFLVLPSKIAELWFPDNQRSIANVLSFVANPAGVALATLVPSFIFQTQQQYSSKTWKIFYYNLGMSGLALFPFILCFFIRRSTPPTPASASSAHHSNPHSFFTQIWMSLSNTQFVVQMLLFAFSFAGLWGFMAIVTDILLLQGYDLQGYPTALCAIIGSITSILAGCLADRTKKFKEIIRFCSIGFALSALTIRIYLRHMNSSWYDPVVIFVLCSLLGAFSIPQFPIGVELGVETTYPVQEATSSGILVLFGQLWMFVIYAIFEYGKLVKWFYTFKADSTPANWQFVLDIWCALNISAAILSVLFLNPVYGRVELEKSALMPANLILQTVGVDLTGRRSRRNTTDYETGTIAAKVEPN
ncbi:hypothetical protein WR25_06478 isoform B [Diploscapter pachys]|uniref:Major facilitator superfamily (MFS) profile domain-containing protein n=1 Tax=Diploscapter pachys TaxID=2018661 RepID=A0A2A2LFC2_9BILA|nr:hypothetical protein WR25_06478 isoform A [Diploscapter pachys]PAV84883.1 hypothetical protein WR25_06478 isoform B [Diploscapter pachys]